MRRTLENGTDEEENGIDVREIAIDPKDEAAEAAIARALTEVGPDDEGGYASIYRAGLGRASKEESYLTKMDIPDFTSYGLDGIRAEFGPGKYRIRIYDGNSALRINRHITLEALPGTVRAAAPENNSTAVILEAMQQMNQNFLAGLNAIVTQMKPEPAPSRREMLQDMVMMKQILGDGGSNNSAANMEILLKGLEIGRSLDGAEPSGAGVFMEMVKQTLPVILQNAGKSQVQTRPQFPQSPRPIPAPMPVPAPQERSIVSEPEITQEESEMQLMFKMQLKLFMAAARSNKEVGPYAEIVLDMMDDDTLVEFADDPLVLEKLIQIEPAIEAHRDWFNRLIAEIRTMTEDDSASNESLTVNPYSSDNEGT